MATKKDQKQENGAVVIDVAKSSLSDLWKKEDYWAIWLGFIILIAGLIIFLPRPPAGMDTDLKNYNQILEQEAARAPFKTIAWYKAAGAKKKLQARNEPYAKTIHKFLATPGGWSVNPLDALYRSQSAADALNQKNQGKYTQTENRTAESLTQAEAAQQAAADAEFKNEALNTEAEAKIEAWQADAAALSKAKSKATNKAYNLIGSLIILAFILAVYFGIGMKIMGKRMGSFIVGFFFVFFIAVLAYMAQSQATMKLYGFGYPLWAIVFGMIISNTIGTPKWVVPALQTEYFIKTGLVLLGAEVLFGKILSIGIPGIFVAWVVTPIVLITTFWFGQKLIKIPSKTLNITISADMSVCGVSAAIATAAACRAKKEELTLAIGLSMVFTAIMMVAMPAFIKAVGIPNILGGAWMGGTIDATGAVAAAGAFLGDQALYVAATIKMIQNVLIGVTAFCVAVYWCARVDCEPGQSVSWMEIWHRFPKFVLGFMVASIIFSYIDGYLGKDVGAIMLDQGVLRGFSRLLRGWFFALAFASIGLATNFRELAKYFKGGKPLILYVCGQSFNLILTLTMAYIMFYLVFPEITGKI